MANEKHQLRVARYQAWQLLVKCEPERFRIARDQSFEGWRPVLLKIKTGLDEAWDVWAEMPEWSFDHDTHA